jgi:phenylacetate-CoA ligase
MSIVEDRKELEQIPIKDLLKMQKAKMREALSRAYKSSLYRERWRVTGFRPDIVQDLRDLTLIPFVTRNELFEATRTKQDEVTCSAVNTWFAGSSPTSSYEWFPFNDRDFLGIAAMLARMSRIVGLRTGDVVLTVVDPFPRIWPTIPFLWTCSEASGVPRVEFIMGSLDWYDTLGMTWIDFVRRRRPTVLFTSTKNALSLADKIHVELKLSAREVLTETRVGIFFGEPLEDSRATLMEAYSLEAYEVYSPTEHMSFWAECDAHLGIHLWMDTCVPEIIPVDSRDALPVWETSPRTIGELVITNFAEGLPLIRYKTGEWIRVEGTDRCVCGRTHPRISRLLKHKDVPG